MCENGLKTTGAPSLEELKASASYPDGTAIRKGAIAIVECVECIPCNPCESACPVGAIRVGKPITNLPSVDYALCTGCGRCISRCPGLAILVKNAAESDTLASVMFPYEYLPLPAVGSSVCMVDRHGAPVCGGTVKRVATNAANHQTAVVTATFEKRFYHEVVSIRRPH